MSWLDNEYRSRLKDINCDDCKYAEECDGDICKWEEEETSAYCDEVDRKLDAILGK